MRLPSRGCAEQAVDETDLVNEKEAQRHAHRAGHPADVPVPGGKTVRRVHERRGERGGDEHHAGDGSDSEEKQVQNPPRRVTYRAEHEKRDGRGARKPAAPCRRSARDSDAEAACLSRDRSLILGRKLVRVGVPGTKLFDVMPKAHHVHHAEDDEHQRNRNSIVSPTRAGRDDAEEGGWLRRPA